MQGATRVSCGSMCRIEHEGKYLLIINRNRLMNKIYQLSPIGGAIAIDDLSVLERFNYKLENPAAKDLRLMLYANEIPDFREWFYKRTGRETSPFREIYEELVEEETAVLPALKPEDLQIKFSGIVEDIKATQRKGATGVFTQYFLEIFDVTVVSPDILMTLFNAPINSGVVWVNEEDARKGYSIELFFDGDTRRVTLNTAYLFK